MNVYCLIVIKTFALNVFINFSLFIIFKTKFQPILQLVSKYRKIFTFKAIFHLINCLVKENIIPFAGTHQFNDNCWLIVIDKQVCSFLLIDLQIVKDY